MNRFIRLETMWDASAWLLPLSDSAQLVWIKMLCYVKNAGRDGRAKRLELIVASRMWNVGEESVKQLLIAAKQHGAIMETDTDWTITKWSQYQTGSTDAARAKRYREKLKASTIVPESEPASRASRVTGVTSREKEKEKEKEKEIPPLSPAKTRGKPTGRDEVNAYFAEKNYPLSEAERFWDYHEAGGWKQGRSPLKDWRAAARYWMSNKKKWDATKPSGQGPTLPRREF